MEALSVVDQFLAAQNDGEAERCLELVAEDAVFDVGRGRYDGREQVKAFVAMLAGRGSRTEVLESRLEGDTVHGLWQQSDDDGRRLGIEWVQLAGGGHRA